MKTKLVIKIGSSLILEKNSINLKYLKDLVRQIAKLKKRGYQVVLVSSGAIVFGRKIGPLKKWPENLAGKQALAALGQPKLMSIYQKFFKKYGLSVAQILLTREDIFSDRYFKVKNPLFTLLKKGVIPIINENDTTATEEIKFGDNDLLSALLAVKIKANLLLLLSNVDGFYDKSGEVIKKIKKITPEIKKMIFPKKEKLTHGGMASKIKAAQISLQANIPCLVANGRRKDILLEILAGKAKGTRFVSLK